ncbi:unknown [Ruminococcus sp. CAG:382]|nr:unknown [Ruminococcus sp. CAG:382]
MRRRHLHRLCPKIEPVLICHLERHDAEAGCTEHIEIRALAFPHVRKAVLLQVVAYPLTLFFFNQQVEVFAAPFIVFTVKPHERHSVDKHISVFPGVEQLQQLFESSVPFFKVLLSRFVLLFNACGQIYRLQTATKQRAESV